MADTALAGRYPLAMISAASHHFLNTVFGNNAELRRRAGKPRVVLHPADATAAVDERDADMGGGAVYHDTRVEVTPLAG